MMASEQSVWIVRYGLTKFPLVENRGPYDSPIDPTEGVEHAKAIAAAIAKDPNKPTVVYSSPFLRTAETAHIIAQECGCRMYIEEGLTEWQTSSLLVDEMGKLTYPKTTSELSKLFSTIDSSYTSVNPADGTEGSPQFEETEELLLKRCKKTIENILKQTDQNICIVSHAPCDQAIAYCLEGAESTDESTLTPWPLGGITKFVGNKMVLYGDTEHMPGVYKRGIKQWSLPCLEKKN